MPEFGFGEFAYYVQTPEQETFYFKDKSEAKDFIEFYNDYANKFPHRIKGKKYGSNTRPKDKS